MKKELTTKDLAYLEKMMEEMAGLPREELGKRQPGERQAREIYAERIDMFDNENTKNGHWIAALRVWRNNDHEDNLVLTRYEVIQLLKDIDKTRNN